MGTLKINLEKNSKKFYDSYEIRSSISADSSFEEYFLPSGFLSSKKDHIEDSFNSIENQINSDTNKIDPESVGIIEYLEYKPSPEKQKKIRFKSISLCASPDLREKIPKKFSQTQKVSALKLIEKEIPDYNQTQESDCKCKYRSLCENYIRQNSILRDEVHECSKEISKLIKSQQKISKKYSLANEEAVKAKKFIKTIMESLGEMLEEKIEITGDEHCYNYIASQIQLLQSRTARKKALYLKTKNNLDELAQDSKETKRQVTELTQANSQLLQKLEKKKLKLKEMKKIIGKKSEKYTEESESRMESSRVSDSSTPLSDDFLRPKLKNRYSRALSDKETPVSEVDCYREALKDLKDLSDRANVKILETKRKLKNSSIGSRLTKPTSKTLNLSETKPTSFIKYYRY